MSRVRVIGCGNPHAGDDAVGLLAVREAHVLLSDEPGVEVVETGGALGVLDLLEGVDAVVVVDAVREPNGLREPGTIVRAEGGSNGLPADVRSSLSSHGLGLAEAVGLGAVLGTSPRVVFLGIEAEDVVAGHALSPRVAEALPALVSLVVDVARALAASRS